MSSSKKNEEKKVVTTPSGLEVDRIYSTSDKGEDSGEFPYTRGIHNSMYRGKLWTMRQYAGFGTAEETNKRYRYLLEQGSTGLSVAFDLPTQMGRDPDHPLVTGEVGKVGVSIATVDDMELLLKEIPLDQVSISMTINSTASILLAFLLVVAEERSVSWDKLRGTIQNDILKEYIARGTYIYPPKSALRIVTDIFGYCSEKVPNWNTISISGYHIREAGSTAQEELGLTFANGITYVQAALDAGLEIDQFAPRVAFFFNCHNDFLEEIAKFRAARRIWAKLMKDRFGAKKEKSHLLRFHTQTAGSSLTAQQPRNNIVRTTIQALAAVLGGTQSLHTNSYDEALGLPTEESARIALRTQQIIAHESGVANSVDPFGGSYLIEEWTDRMEREVNQIISTIDKKGGMVGAIEEGYPQSLIESSAYRYQQEIEDQEQIIVGVNRFDTDSVREVPVMPLDSKGESEQIYKLKAFRGKRNSSEVKESLAALKAGAEGEDNLMPLIVDAVRKRATLGEISDILREVFGEYRAT